MEKIEGINLKKLVEECEIALEEEKRWKIKEVLEKIERTCGRSNGTFPRFSPWMRPY